ncbi:unnamed protein product, partial [Closterium sp. Naga37s-1]
MVLKVKMEEVTGMGECVAALEAKLSEQGDAMAALKREMADMRRDMALLKGLAEGAGKGSASGKAAEGSGAQPLKGAQVEAARREASEMRGEMGALKAELARMRGAAERQAAEVAYVKATAAHSEARINDVELALAAIKDGRAEKRKEGSGEGQAAAERREGKRRKREERGEEEDMADVPGVDGLALVVAGRAPEGKRDEAERDGDAKEKEEEEDGAEYVDPEDDVQNLRARVEVLEKLSDREGHAWEELIALWVEVRPGKARLDLSGVCLIDGALTRATALRSLTPPCLPPLLPPLLPFPSRAPPAPHPPGLVHSGVLTAAMQWSGRSHVLFTVLGRLPQIQQQASVFILLLTWSLSEVIRYPQYAFSLLGCCPEWLTWL